MTPSFSVFRISRHPPAPCEGKYDTLHVVRVGDARRKLVIDDGFSVEQLPFCETNEDPGIPPLAGRFLISILGSMDDGGEGEAQCNRIDLLSYTLFEENT